MAGEILIKIKACGVCHTDLDEIEGRIILDRLPIVPGHQVTGIVEESRSALYKHGDKVGIGWIYSSCGECSFCLEGRENLCGKFIATGRDVNGGYAEYMTARETFAYKLPEGLDCVNSAPLLCAGGVGYRALKLAMTGGCRRLGLTGFGGSAHLVLKLVGAMHPDIKVYVFARSEAQRDFAKALGAEWTGATEELSPEGLDCIIDTTPSWKAFAEALKNLKPGGRLVINAIRKDDAEREFLRALDYERDLWMEKEIKSVANATRNDIAEFLSLAGKYSIVPETREYRLGEANVAAGELKAGKVIGSLVLVN